MRYCSKCGTKLTDDQIYCPKCGNKEPLIKNDKQSSWKDFDDTGKKVTNVNYDFATTQEQQKQKVATNKTLNILGKTLRIVEIVTGVFFFVVALVSVIFNKQSSVSTTLAIISLVLAAIDVLLLIPLIVIAAVTKVWNVQYKNAYVSSAILNVFMLGLAIAQYFLIKTSGFSPMGFMMGIMLIACNAMLSQVHSFKKTAK